MQDDYPMSNPTPFTPTKRKVLRLDDTARAVAQRRIAEARKGRMDPCVHDVSLQEFLQGVWVI